MLFTLTTNINQIPPTTTQTLALSSIAYIQFTKMPPAIDFQQLLNSLVWALTISIAANITLTRAFKDPGDNQPQSDEQVCRSV